ncbi:spindle pole body interacting protein [Cutaneotrichosporon oleaginosum]|uniref:Spindle pole body interacting protein n=1 Tax=Cutaneotrichosporon oleaginosum TaxID=879819 RepID=A0A0J0XWU0_9TREE|nr:spindle pole body interacting protein [Cutaneotrichosporon oleaginosum]KLT45532.1 spindle pole body interacting protein [Cutaneotrichosporon oleaginosum]TXT14514.1 hypothetical protein COLE_00707 [Cutaneotrichosporon oleaginosum]
MSAPPPTLPVPEGAASDDFEADAGVEDGPPKEEAVHFCLLAEFDIDAGATLAHQYPYPTGTEEHRLAELMLPDGAHLRGEDWTVFYLGQTESMSVSPMLSHEDKARMSKRMSMLPPSERPRRGTPGGGLLYVLNCVRMKEDKSVRRGAMVKAMAIATPHPHIGIYKPLLLLALDEYFNNPSPEVLAKLYDSANNISVVGMPKLNRHEQILLRQSDRKDMFEARFGQHAPQTAADDDTADVSSIAEASTRAPSISSSRPPVTRKDSSSSSQVYMSYNDMPKRHGVPRDTHFFETEAKFKKITVPIRIPMTVFDEDVGDYSIIELVQTFSQNVQPFPPPFHPALHTNGAYTHPVFLIFNAMLAHKRIIFLGHGRPANQVARMVLAACAMVSGCGQVLRGFTETAFPYANLASLDVLEEFDGYVAGVCNPRFEELPSTWDVLCNLETGRVTVSKELQMPGTVQGTKSDLTSDRSVNTGGKDEDSAMAGGKAHSVSKTDCLDNQFVEEILTASSAHYGEGHIRVRWTDYISRFVRLVAYQEQLHLGSTRLGWQYQPFRDGHLGSGIVFIDDDLRQREMRGNAHRIDAWRKTKSYRLAQKDWVREQENAAIRGFDALHNVKRLRMTRSMSNKEAELIYSTMVRQVRTYDQVVELLTYLPMHFGGLIPVANGLIHPLASVRNDCLDLLCTINQYTVGRHALLTLNYFLRKTFVELLERREATRALQRRFDEPEKTPATARAGELAAQQAQPAALKA